MDIMGKHAVAMMNQGLPEELRSKYQQFTFFYIVGGKSVQERSSGSNGERIMCQESYIVIRMYINTKSKTSIM